MTSRDRTMETCYILLVPAGLWAPEHVVSRRDFIYALSERTTLEPRARLRVSDLGYIFYICSFFVPVDCVVGSSGRSAKLTFCFTFSRFHKICSKMCAYKAMSAAQKPEQRCSTHTHQHCFTCSKIRMESATRGAARRAQRQQNGPHDRKEFRWALKA